MAASKLDIYNLALTFLGAPTIMSVSDNGKNARAITSIYDIIRLGELRQAPPWNFSIKEAQLPAITDTPLFDRSYIYQLPANFVALAAPYPEANYNDRDWLIQGGKIYTNYSAPLNIRYVQDIEDTSVMDALFIKAFAAMIAYTVGDSITQSNAKVQMMKVKYDDFIADARKANSFDNVAESFALDSYITCRQ